MSVPEQIARAFLAYSEQEQAAFVAGIALGSAKVSDEALLALMNPARTSDARP